MRDSMAKIAIETMARKAIRDIRETPESSMRNIVEMAQQFSNGRFQKKFFEIIHRMLEDETSGYYAMVSDTARHVDPERLLNFGMNLGYNSCMTGADKIRTWEKNFGYNVPWNICLDIGRDSMQKYLKSYYRIIRECEEMGIYTCMLFMEQYERDVFLMIREYPDSAFFVFCRAEAVTEEFLDDIQSLNNVMILLRYDEAAGRACGRLREEGQLYGCYYPYGEEDAEKICSGDLFYGMQQLHPVISVMVSEKGCPEHIRQRIYRTVCEARSSQEYRTLLWELYGDNCYVDRIISEDDCCVSFDQDGNLCAVSVGTSTVNVNVFRDSLQNILSQAFLKKQAAAGTLSGESNTPLQATGYQVCNAVKQWGI